MIQKDFAGLNNFVWFTGVVANNQDKAQVGRIRVRIIGWHNENKNLQPDEELPWAQVLLPVNASRTISLPKPGEWVFGFFQDGNNGQMPVIVGVYPRIQTKQVRDANSSTQTLAQMEAQLVVEKQKLQELLKQKVSENAGGAAFVSPNGLRNNVSNQIVLTNINGNFVSTLPIKSASSSTAYKFSTYRPYEQKLVQIDVLVDPPGANSSSYSANTIIREFPEVFTPITTVIPDPEVIDLETGYGVYDLEDDLKD